MEMLSECRTSLAVRLTSREFSLFIAETQNFFQKELLEIVLIVILFFPSR